MPIDARIPLGIQPMQPFDLARGAQQGAQLARMQAISQREQAQAQQEQAEAARQAKADAAKEQVKAVLSRYQGDMGKALPEIYAIDPDVGMKIQKTWNDSRESDFTLNTAKLGYDKLLAQEVGRKAQGVTDQDSYGYFLANLKASGLPTEGMPPTYDPGYVESLKTKSLTVLENANLREKELAVQYQRWKTEQDLKDKAADNARADTGQRETARHNRTMEARQPADPLVAIQGPNGPVYVPRSQAVGKAPAVTGTAAGGAKLAAAQETEMADMMTVEQLADDVLSLGEKIKWSGVGGMYQGTISQFGARHLGMGTQDEEILRNNIGNVLGTIAKIRGGTAFTDAEKALMETYTPTIDDSPLQLKAKLGSLKTFIKNKRTNLLKVASGDYTSSGPSQAAPKPKADPLGIR